MKTTERIIEADKFHNHYQALAMTHAKRMAELLEEAEELIKAVPDYDEMPAYYMWLADFKKFQEQE